MNMIMDKHSFTNHYNNGKCDKNFLDNLYDKLIENNIPFKQGSTHLSTKWHNLGFHSDHLLVFETPENCSRNCVNMVKFIPYDSVNADTVSTIMEYLLKDTVVRTVDKEVFIENLSKTSYSEDVLNEFYEELIRSKVDFILNGLTLYINDTVTDFHDSSFKIIYHPYIGLKMWTNENGERTTGGFTYNYDNSVGLIPYFLRICHTQNQWV